MKNCINKNDLIVDYSPIREKSVKYNHVDLLEEITKHIRSIEKEKQPKAVYRIQHQKEDQTEEMVISLLPILDSFENLLSFATQFQDNEILGNWMTSMGGIYKRMRKILMKQGLQPIDSIGIPVDFGVHEVVEYRQVPDGIPNIIIEEQQKGYMFKGKLIREARVVVSNS